MPHEAPIRIIQPTHDPQAKHGPDDSYAEFDLAPLGIAIVDGVDVSQAGPVRLPTTVEPGCCYTLAVAFTGAVIVIEDDLRSSLFPAPRVIVTEELTIQRLPAS